MQYRIIKPIVKKSDIIGYEVTDESGGIKRFRIDDIYKLIENGIVDGKIVLDDKNIKHLYYDKNSIKTDEDTNYIIEYRIERDGKIVAYKCKKSDGTSIKIAPNKLWELAADGKVENAKGLVINNKIALVGKGISLSDISTLKI